MKDRGPKLGPDLVVHVHRYLGHDGLLVYQWDQNIRHAVPAIRPKTIEIPL